ncbi:MAG: permease [Labrys sp. (in: a-proteobacteria)]
MSAATLPVGGLLWYARHELRLAWRDWLAMMTAGKPHRRRLLVLVFLFGAAALHAIAWSVVPIEIGALAGDKPTLVTLGGSAFLAWTLMLSQAMESVTRGFYARADLDLILSSPTSARLVFALRMGSIALATILLATLLVGPFINILAWRGGGAYLAAYGLLMAMGMVATAIAILLTVALFRLLGPRRTRFIAQVIAAIVGAGFVIGVQAVAILSYGNMSRLAAFQSAEWIAAAPDPSSLVWLPARAASGDLEALIAMLLVAGVLLAATIAMVAARFGQIATAAAGIAFEPRRSRRLFTFRPRSADAVLRHKEWTLLIRDPWLVSQSLMQVLYLIPPALLLWRNFGSDVGSLVVLAPVIVMAAGQLAGGLAWLAISGEDAPDLVATAPVRPAAVLRAKVEAVLLAVLVPLMPLVVAISAVSYRIAAVTLLGTLVAAASATLIQIFFRRQAKRSHFRRRQTSSRIATFAEAFVSLSWAAAAGLFAAGTWYAVGPALFAISLLFAVRAVSGRNG